MTRVRRWPAMAVALAILWLFVRGVALDPRTVAGELLIGLLVGGLVAFPLRRFYADEVDLGHVVRAVPPALGYLGRFAREIVVANLDVAYRVLSPSLPIEPDVIEVPLRVESGLAVTTIANSITLTPGTLTMDHDAETNTLYVHAISADDREGVLAPIRDWEDYALRVFGEDADPDDPPPPRPSERGVPPGGRAAGTAPDAATSEGTDRGGDDRGAADEPRRSRRGDDRGDGRGGDAG